MPAQTQALVETHRLRLLGKPLGIIKLIQNDRSFKLAGQDKLTWQKATGTLKDRVGAVKELFKRLKP